MLRDFKFLRKNSGKNEEIENIPANPRDSLASQASSDASTRPPLNTIQDPTATPKPEPESSFRSRIDRTPTKPKTRNPDSSLPLKTPDKHGFLSKNRFGWAQKNDAADDFRADARNGGLANMTPRVNRGVGRPTSSYSDCNSTQTTPTKSVSKPPTTASRSRIDGNGGMRLGNYAALYKGVPSSCGPPTIVNTVEVPHFDLREDPSFWMDHNVQVLIRVRPLNSMEKSMHGYNRCLKQESAQSITWIGQPETRFTFDHVACETVDQEMLFRMAGLPMVENCLSGYNSCMFAYGQTGSGKTYTMLGEIEDLEVKPSANRGMTPRIFEFLFARIQAEEESRRDEKLKYNCKCSFLEIYNEQITDLLDPSSNNLLLREDVKKGVYVENLSEFEVLTVSDILKLLAEGSLNRKVAATNMNRESSRSHSVFTCVIESRWEKDSATNLRFARLNLVDLAGSERQKTSGAEGERLKEAANINKSLSTLGHVIMILLDVAHGKPRHVPYRDSKLTFLLQDSLGGNSKTMIIANVSPSICCAAETLHTLKFAQRAKLIQNNAVVNEDSTGDVVALQNQIRLLKEELSALKRQNVSRSLSFCSTTVDSEQLQENSYKDNISEMDQQRLDDLLGCEGKNIVRVSTKQLKSLEATLAGALRREQMAETSIKKLEAEIEQLNRLVRQREEDSRSTKMMLRFRENKIQRMESLVCGSLPANSFLLEENKVLSEEIQLLQSKVDKNPEVTRFALENIRLLDQLRRFQEFYEEGERDILLDEVSKLRDQLVQRLDGYSKHHIHPSLSMQSQEAICTSKENDSVLLELKNTLNELEECKCNLNSCLEKNAKLSREIYDLRSLLKDLQSASENQYDSAKIVKDTDQNEDVAGMHANEVVKDVEQIMDLQLELDIVKIILQEEKSSRGELEQRVKCLTRELEVEKDKLLLMNKQSENVNNELKEAKSVIEALESQQLLSINEMEDLRNSHHVKLLSEKELEVASLKKQLSSKELSDQATSGQFNYGDSPLQVKLRRMHVSLEKAKRMNMWYQNDRAFQVSNEEEMDEVRRQVEGETAEVIVCMQEELASLQQEVQDCHMREMEAKKGTELLEAELNELQERACLLTEDNKVLLGKLDEKDGQLQMLTEEWELLTSEVENILADGHEELVDALDQLEHISSSFPQKRIWISEQVGRLIRTISEKELLIEDFGRCLEDANDKRINLECMLKSLRGAALVINEAQQQECNEKEKEILLLKSQLSAKTSNILKLEDEMKIAEDQIRKASVCATVAFIIVNRLSETNVSHLNALNLKDIQLRQSADMILRKDALLKDQAGMIEEAEKQIFFFKNEVGKSEEACAELGRRLLEEEKRACAMTQKLEDKMKVAEDQIRKASVCATVAFIIVNRLSETNVSHLNALNLKDIQLRQSADMILRKDALLKDQADMIEEAEKQIFFFKNEVGKSEEACAELGRRLLEEEKRACAMTQKVEDKMKVAEDQFKKASVCATVGFIIVNRLSETNFNHLNALNLKDIQLRDLEGMVLKKDSLLKDQADMIDEAEKQIYFLKNDLEKSQETCAELDQRLSEEKQHACAMKQKLDDIEENEILKTQEKLAELKTGVSTLRSCMNMEQDESPKRNTEGICASAHGSDGLELRTNISESFFKVDKSLHGCSCDQKSVPSRKTCKNVCDRDVTLILLKKEIESALESLHEVQAQMAKFCHEKEDIWKHKKQSEESIEYLTTQVLALEESMTNFGKLSELKIQAVNHKLNAFEQTMEVARKHWCQAKEFLEHEVGDAKVIATQKAAEAYCILAKFEEAQDTLKEADIIINGLMLANETMKLDIERLRQTKATLVNERDVLSNQVQNLQSINIQKDQQLESLEQQFGSSLTETRDLVVELEGLIAQFPTTVKDGFLAIARDYDCIKSLLLDSMQLVRSSLEDVWSEIIVKDCAVSVLHLCHMGILLETVTGLNAENGLLQHGLSESNTVIADLRDHNSKSRRELEICRVLKGKLLSDIKNSFDRIARKEEETGELSVKLVSFEKQIYDLQLQEEAMLQRSNYMGSQLAVLTKELDSSKSDFFASLLDQEKLLKDKQEIFQAQAETFMIELCSKDFESLVLTLELGEMAVHLTDAEKELISTYSMLDSLKKEVIFSKVDALLVEQLLLDREVASAILQEKLEQSQSEVMKLKSENSLLLQDLEEKKAKLDSSLSCINSFDTETCRLQDKIFSLETCICRLETDLEMRNAELNGLKHSQSSINEDLCLKTLDLQIFIERVNALKEENALLTKELRYSKNTEHETYSRLSLDTGKCVDSLETIDMMGNRLFNILNKGGIMIVDKMCQEVQENAHKISKFLEEFEYLECLAKELASDNVTLQAELLRKDDVLKGLLFDLSLLQESASNVKDQRDEIEEMTSSLEALEDELAVKSSELDKAVIHGQMLEAQLKEKTDMISNLQFDISNERESLRLLSCENKELRAHIEDALAAKCSLEEELREGKKTSESLELELAEMGNTIGQMNDTIEFLRNSLNDLDSERNQLHEEVVALEEKLGKAEANAKENEIIAVEAQQISESRRAYAEDKEAEVKLLERSVEELECTINVLENKVDIIKGETERQRLQREELESELHAIKNQMQNVQNADADMKRHFHEKEKDLQQALEHIQILEKDIADKDAEIAHCKAHLSELNLHAEAQANEYKQKFKALEAMAEKVKPESHFNHVASHSSSKSEKNAAKGRGSGSPFKCIGLGLAQQVKSEKDEDLTAARIRIEDLESLAASRQKEIFALNARLAAAESMTHDVIRDLLGVKLDMTNYVSLLDNQQVQKITEKVRQNSVKSQVKEEEVVMLKQQLNEFIEERRGWLEEIDRKQAELVAAQIALEKLRQRDQLYKTENEMLKMENVNRRKKVMELEEEVKKLSGQQNLQQRIHHHAKIKEENNMLKAQNGDLSAKLRRTEVILARVREELNHCRASTGKSSFDFDEEQRLNNKLKEAEDDRVQLAQKLLGLCTIVLKAAGITKPVSDICPAAAEEALEHLKSKVSSLEREIQNLTLKNRITSERNRLSELLPQNSPLSPRTDENCQTPRRAFQAPFLSSLDR